MSVQPPRPRRTPHPLQRRPTGQEWGQATYRQEEPEARGGAGCAVAGLLSLAFVVLCVAGFFLARILLPDSPPTIPPTFGAWTASPLTTTPGPVLTGPVGTPGQAWLALDPDRGFVNTLVTVTGQGWWSNEAVFIFLRAPSEGGGPAYAYAAAVADDRGDIHTAFTFPNETRWRGEQWAEVIAQGTRSGLQASARFTLVPPTATNTVPPPTPRPTSPPTDTPLTTDTPTPSPTPTPTPQLVITDWLGEYFANMTLSGDPVFIRNDVGVDFNWGAGSPGPDIPLDEFSVRWTRQQQFAEGFYRFTITVDDGVRFWVDGELVVDEWHDGSASYSVDRYLAPGAHPLRLEYYENLGGAMIQLTWTQGEPPTATPSPTLTPTPTGTPLPPPPPTVTPPPTAPPAPALPDRWQATYYANPTLSGQPTLVREDAAVDFNWGGGSPGAGIPPDSFSARWTGEVWLSGGRYRYVLTADDGARLWVDKLLVIDIWFTGGGTYEARILLPPGVHTFQVEYFEDTADAYIHLWGETVVRP